MAAGISQAHRCLAACLPGRSRHAPSSLRHTHLHDVAPRVLQYEDVVLCEPHDLLVGKGVHKGLARVVACQESLAGLREGVERKMQQSGPNSMQTQVPQRQSRVALRGYALVNAPGAQLAIRWPGPATLSSTAAAQINIQPRLPASA